MLAHCRYKQRESRGRFEPRPYLPATEVPVDIVGPAVIEYVKRHSTKPDDAQVYLLDTKYWLCDLETFDQFRREDWTELAPYLAERSDCDDRARQLWAAASMRGLTGVGLVIDWSGRHAYNLVLFADGHIRLYEPATDGWVEPDLPAYRLDHCLVLM